MRQYAEAVRAVRLFLEGRHKDLAQRAARTHGRR